MMDASKKTTMRIEMNLIKNTLQFAYRLFDNHVEKFADVSILGVTLLSIGAMIFTIVAAILGT